MRSMKSFVNGYKIRIENEMVGENPHMVDKNWKAYHYKSTLKFRGRQMTVFFSMGMAHNNEPTQEDVLSCLASDSSSVDNNSFEEWCRDLGYDTDSRKAEKTYNICVKQAKRLKQFLGDSLYEELLYETEPH